MKFRMQQSEMYGWFCCFATRSAWLSFKHGALPLTSTKLI